MRIKNVNGAYVFARNPVVVESSFSGADFDPKGGRISVAIDGENVYTGRFSAPLSMDLSEILDSNIPYFPEAQKSEQIIQQIEGNYERYSVEVEASYGGMDDYISFIALPGGVSNQNFYSWVQWGADALSGRFLANFCNFFLTTRHASWIVAMKETEMHPLYFFRKTAQGPELFQIFNPVTGEELLASIVGGGCYAIDIDKLRRSTFMSKKGLINAFDVHVDGELACRIVIERAELSEHRHRLKFRNSLGVFEIMETTGNLNLTPEYDDGAVFKRLNPITRSLYNERERTLRSMTATLYTGTKHRDELSFLMDMLSSDEVYLLDFCEGPVRVIPTAKKLEIPTDVTTPLEAELSLQFVEPESNILQDIFTGNESRRQRVFSEQFNDKFN